MDDYQDYQDYQELENSEDVPYHERAETYIIPVVSVITSVIGVIGNATLIFIFIRHRNMRNVVNTYVISLAVSDLLANIFSTPFISLEYVFPVYPFGEFMCKISKSVHELYGCVTSFTLVALSVEVYISVRRTTGGCVPRSTIIILCIWAFAFLIATPTFIFSHIVSFVGKHNADYEICVSLPRNLDTWLFYLKASFFTVSLAFYVIPLCIIAIFSVLTRQLVQSISDKIASKTVLVLAVVFAACLLPAKVLTICHFNGFEVYNAIWHAFLILTHCVDVLSTCLNPVALCCVNHDFRQHMLCCFRGRDASPSSEMMATWDSTSAVRLETPDAQLLVRTHEDPRSLAATTPMDANGGQGVDD